jgi:hypothetical protein
MKTVVKLAAGVAALALLSACGQSGEPEAKTEAPAASAMTTSAQPSLAVSAASTPAPGQPVSLILRLTSADGKPLGPDAIAVSHEHKVHVMIVDSALEDYTHAHAEPGGAPGQWTVSFTPQHPREYRVWTDFKLASAEEHAGHQGHEGHGEMASHDGPDAHAPTPSATLRVGDEAGPAVAAVPSLSTTVDDYAFTLSLGGALQADAHVPATLTVADASGNPVSTLEPLMGAYAHLVGFSADGASMVHGHPEGEEPKDASARGGPALTFELHPTVAGPNRVFVQVKIAGKVITAPFTLVVGG